MNAQAFVRIGVEQTNKGNLKEAAEAFVEAIKLKPNYAEAYHCLGNVFNVGGRLEAAENCLQKAIQLNPNYCEAYHDLGLLFMATKRLVEAEAYLREATKRNNNFLEAFHNLGLVLSEVNKQEEAESCFRRAVELKPNSPIVYNNLGRFFLGLNRLDEAKVCLRRSIAFNQDYPEADLELGFVCLLRGEYEEGWEWYESRCKMPDNAQPGVRRWQGEDLTGRKILLFHEQGLGDTLQFIRYADAVAELAGETIVWVQKPLKRLLAGMEHKFVVRSGATIPLSQYSFDFACPLLSLPRLFHTTEETLPQKIPYIAPKADTVDKWRTALDDAVDSKFPRIGVVWAGNLSSMGGHTRPIPFEVFSQLFAVNGIHWVSLQVGGQAMDLAGTAYKVADFSDKLVDFEETAGLVANLDAVITVDTSVAHLAGAMGKTTLTLLPFAPDWRWQLGRMDNPWYPTMHLFRQPAIGEWPMVIEQVKKALVQILKAFER